MAQSTIETRPIEGQKPSTSGLRKKAQVFMETPYLENFVQSIWAGIGGADGKTFVVGGDGRYFNDRAIQVILRMTAASGARKVIVGQDGPLSTPAASNVIRARGADGGIILSASHNPGGPDEDLGIKFNMPNGGPAPEDVTNRIYQATRTIGSYDILDAPDVDLSALGETALAGQVMDRVRAPLGSLPGQSFPAGTVLAADEFAYDDPVDGSRSEGQGLRVMFDTGARVVFRLSGTGTVGATIRVYLEAYEGDPSKVNMDPGKALANVIETAEALSDLKAITGRSGPDVTT